MKRERNTNFSREETENLISLIETYKNIIENKKSDAATWQEKEKAWKAIEFEYNSCGVGVYRDARHLKLKYEAIKRDTRKKANHIAQQNENGSSINIILLSPPRFILPCSSTPVRQANPHTIFSAVVVKNKRAGNPTPTTLWARCPSGLIHSFVRTRNDRTQYKKNA